MHKLSALAATVFVMLALLTSAAAAPAEPEWKRTSWYRSLNPSQQARQLKNYEDLVDTVADKLRASAPAPLSVQHDNRIVEFARCAVDGLITEGLRQGKPVEELSESDGTRHMDRCADQMKKRYVAGKAKTVAKIDVVDFMLDFDSYTGRDVIVRGSLAQRGDLTLLHAPGRPDVFVLVNTGMLTRDERKRVLLDCAKGCMVEVHGEAKNILGQKGLIATNLR